MASERLTIVVNDRGTRTVQRNLDSLGTGAQRADASVGLLKRSLAGLGAGIGLASAVNTLASFSQEMSTVRAISRATEGQFDRLGQKARELGTNTRFSATEAAQGMTFLARAGFSAEETLDSIEDTLNLAQAGALSLASAADIASNVLQGFQLEAAAAGHAADVLAYASNNSNTNVEQLGQALAYVAPIAQSANISMEQTTASIGALSNAGIQGMRAGTGLRGVIASLQSPTGQASQVLKELGLTMADVNVQQRGLVPVLETLREAGLDTGQMFRFFGREAAPAFSVLQQSIPTLRSMTGELQNADGTARATAETMDNNLNGAILSVKSATEGLIIAMGDLGGSSALTGGFSALAATLRLLADNAGLVGDAIGIAAAVMLGRGVSALGQMLKSSRAQASQNLKLIATEKTKAAVTLRSAQAENSAATSANNLAKAEYNAARGTNAEQAARQRLMATQRRALTARVSLQQATERATAANAAYARSTTFLGRVSTAASASVRGLRTALSFLGGPAGALLVAAGAMLQWANNGNEAARSAASLSENVDELTRKFEELNKVQRRSFLAKQREQLLSIDNSIDQTTARIAQMKYELGMEGGDSSVRGLVGTLGTTMSGISRGLGITNGTERSAYENQLEMLQGQLADLQQARERTQGLLNNLDVEEGARNPAPPKKENGPENTIETPEFNQTLDNAVNGGMSESQRQEQQALEQRVRGLRSLRDELDPIGSAQRELVETRKLLTQSVRDGNISDQEAIKLMEKKQTSLQDQLNPLAAANDELDKQRSLLIKTNDEQQIANQLERITQDLQRSGIALSTSETSQLRSKLEAMQQLKKEQQAQRRVLDELNGPTERIQEQQKAYNQLLKQGRISAQQYRQGLVEMKTDLAELRLEAGDGSWTDVAVSSFSQLTQGYESVMSGLANSLGGTLRTLGDGFADSIGRALVYSESLSASLKEVARNAVSQLISSLIKLGIQYVTMSTLGNSLMAATTAASTAAAGATAAAWAPAAAMASLATFGANSGPAMAGLTTTMATAQGLATASSATGLLGFEEGGYTGDVGRKSVAGVVHGQEYVMNADATRKNREVLEHMNRGGNVGVPNVVIEDHGADVQVAHVSRDEVRIIARQEAGNELQKNGPKMVSDEIANPNSKTSRSLGRNTDVKRNRR